MFDLLRKICDNDWFLLIGFISTIAWIWGVMKAGFKIMSSERGKNILRDSIISMIFLSIGLLIPAAMIIGTWEMGWGFWKILIYILSFYSIYSLFLLIKMLYQVNKILKESEKK